MTRSKLQERRLQFALPSRYRGLPILEPHYVEPYLAGIRAALIFRGEVGTAVTLLGREIPNAWPVIDELTMSCLVENMVIDGEFTTTMPSDLSALMADQRYREDIYGLTFNAYDIMTVEQWDTKTCDTPLHNRKSVLMTLLLRGEYVRTVFTSACFTSSPTERDLAKRILLEHNCEAVVYKDINAPYPFGSTLDWTIDRT